MVGRSVRVLAAVLALLMLWATGATASPRLDLSPTAGATSAVTGANDLAPADRIGVAKHRLGGENRTATSVEISKAAFPTGSEVVYLARRDVLADALAAGMLTDGPILLVSACRAVPDVVAAEIARLDPQRVVALGGEVSICQDTLDQVASGRQKGRLAGDNRYGTAVAISRHQFPTGPVAELYIANGADSADALVGGVLTAGPVLLVPNGRSTPSVVAEEIDRLAPRRVVALGGPVALTDATVADAADGRPMDRLAGENRYGTSVAVGSYQFNGPAPVAYIARGDVFADAAVSGILTDGPVFLVRDKCGTVPTEVAEGLAELSPTKVVALGGEVAVCEATLDAAIASIPPPEVAVVVAPEVEVLTPDELDQVESFDPATGRIVLGDGAPTVAAIGIGDVVVGGHSDAVPQGFLRRVQQVHLTADGGFQLDTVEASLPEAVADTNGLVGGEPVLLASYVEPAAGVEVVYGAVAAEQRSVRPEGLAAEAVEVQLEHTLAMTKSFDAKTPDAAFTGTGSLDLRAEVTIGGVLVADADIEWFELKELRFEAGPKARVSASAAVTGALEGKATPALGKITRFWSFPVGPVPVVLTETSDLEIEATITTSGSVGVETGIDAESRVGIHYVDGSLTPILNSAGEVIDPRLTGGVTAGVGLTVGPSTEVLAYGIAGIKSKAGPWASATYTASESSPLSCRLRAGLQASLSAVAGINILGLKAQLEKEQGVTLTLLDEELCAPEQPEPGALAISTTALPEAVSGEPYDAQLLATGGRPPYAWTRSGGTLPGGITLSSDGRLTGLPTEPGNHKPVLRVVDADGSSQEATVGLTVRSTETGPPIPGAGTPTNFEREWDREYFTDTVLLPDGSLRLCSVGSGTYLPTIEVQPDGSWSTGDPECVISMSSTGLAFAQRELSGGWIELLAMQDGATIWEDPTRRYAWPTGYGATLATGDHYELIDPETGASLAQFGETRFSGVPTETRANQKYGAIATTSNVRYFDRETLQLTEGRVSGPLVSSAALLTDLTGVSATHVDTTYSCTIMISTTDPTGIHRSEQTHRVSEWEKCDTTLVSAGQTAYLMVRHAAFEGQTHVGSDVWRVRADASLERVGSFGRWAGIAGDSSGQAVVVEGDIVDDPQEKPDRYEWRSYTVSASNEITLIDGGSAYGQVVPDVVIGYGQVFLQWVDYLPENPYERRQHLRSVVVAGLEGESDRTSFYRPSHP